MLNLVLYCHRFLEMPLACSCCCMPYTCTRLEQERIRIRSLLFLSSSTCLWKSVVFQICYFFYKNIAFGLTLFYFEAFTGFSGQSIYDDLYMLSFNVILTSLPVISLGVFEQDVSSEVCLQVSPPSDTLLIIWPFIV